MVSDCIVVYMSEQKRITQKGGDMKQKTRAIGYVRVSTREQGEKGISLKSQKKMIQNYAELEGLTLLQIVEDRGRSGKNLNRPGIEQVIELCEKRGIDHIIVYKLDRLTRKTIDLLSLVEKVFTRNDIEFHSITEKIDTTTAQGKFFLTLMGAMAQMERDLISERTIDALRYKKERGEFVGAPPLGYKAKKKKLVKNVGEMKAVELIKQHKGKTLQEIADILNAKGLQGKRGGLFYPSTVSYIRNNERYASA